MSYKEIELGRDVSISLSWAKERGKLEVFDFHEGVVAVRLTPSQALELASLLLQFSSQAPKP